MPRKDSKSGGKSSGGYSNKRVNDASNSSKRSYAYADTYYKNFNTNEAKMNDARIESFLSGLPIIGGFVRGYNQARYMEDYYKNTGMVPNYPGLSMSGYSGLGNVTGNLALSALSGGRSAGYNVKEGTNDLLTFYNYAYA